jgi:hypothetical protein
MNATTEDVRTLQNACESVDRQLSERIAEVCKLEDLMMAGDNLISVGMGLTQLRWMLIQTKDNLRRDVDART